MNIERELFGIAGGLACLWLAWKIGLFGFMDRIVDALFDSPPFVLHPVGADSEEHLKQLRQHNAHVFTSWLELRGFIAMHFSEMDEDDIEDYQDECQDAALKCKPGQILCFIVTESGQKPLLPRVA